MSRRRDLAVGLLVAVLLAALVVGPGLGPGRLLGHQNLDNWAHAWGMHWFTTELFSGRVPWQIHGAAFPESRVLWYVDPLGALLASPLQLFGPAVAYNGLQLFQVAVAGFSGWSLGRALGGRGWVAAVGVATMPLLQSELHNGVVEASWVGLIAGAAALAAMGSRWTGVVVGLVGVASPYHGLGAAALAGTLLLMGGPEGHGSWPDRLKACALAAGLSLLVTLPHALMLGKGFGSTEPFVLRPMWSGMNDPSMRLNATDLVAYLRPGDFWSLMPSDAPTAVPWKHTPYLGWLLLAGSLWAWFKGRRLRWMGLPFAFSLIISLGYFLWHDEQFVTTAEGLRFKLPLAYVSEWFHVELTHHMRFVGMACVVLAGLADRASGRWGPLVAVLVGLENLAVAPNCWPPPSSDATLPAVLAELPDDGLAVVDLPAMLGEGNATNRYLYWEALHGHPVPWNNKVGMTGYQNEALASWVKLSRQEHVGSGDLGPAVEALRVAGFGYVVLHPAYAERPDVLSRHRRALDGLLGNPVQVGEDLLYEL